MKTISILIPTILGSAGLFGLIQYLISRHDNKKNDLAEIKREIGKIKDGQTDTNIRVTRMELTNLLRHDPDNIDAVLQVAEHYFIELDGNAYAHAMFEKWAIEHGVAIGWLPKISKSGKNERREQNGD